MPVENLRSRVRPTQCVLALGLLLLGLACSDRDPVSVNDDDPATGSFTLNLELPISQLPESGGEPSPKPFDGVVGGNVVLTMQILDETQGTVAVINRDVPASATTVSVDVELPATGSPRYTASIVVVGRRTRPTGLTEHGILHRGTTTEFLVNPNETTSQNLRLPDLVPQLWVLEIPSVQHELHWSPVDGAVGYRINRGSPGGIPTVIENAGLDTTLVLAPGFAEGGNIEYRVQAVLADGVEAALSEARLALDAGSIAPSRIGDLRVRQLLPTQVLLEWTAPGDDGTAGRSTSYELRRSSSVLTEGNFELADLVVGVAPPNASGEVETIVVSGLEEQATYYFAIVALDEADNRSEISNFLELTTPISADTEAPTATLDLTLDMPEEGVLVLSWSAPADARDGQAASYDLRYATTELSAENFPAGTKLTTTLVPALPGTREELRIEDLPRATYWFGLRSEDSAGNVSAVSNLVSGTSTDREAPGAVDDLSVESEGPGGARLRWTGSGDNGRNGRPARFEIRFAEFEIDESNLESASLASNLPDPGDSGSAHEFVLSGLRAETIYWIALRTFDEVENASSLSNLAQIETDDFESPERTDDLVAEEVTGQRATLFWTAPGDNETDGTATLYDLRFSGDPITEENFDDASVVGNMPVPSIGGTNEQVDLQASEAVEVYLALKTSDEVGNISELSNVVFVRFGDPPPDAPTNLDVVTQSAQAVQLSWTYSGAEDYFEVERKADGGNFQRIGIVDRNGLLPAGLALTAPEVERLERPLGIIEALAEQIHQPPAKRPDGDTVVVNDTSVAERTTYTYRIRAFSSGGPSGYSNESSDRTLLGTPRDLRVEALGEASIFLSWSQSRNPDAYGIERRSGSGNFLLVAEVSGQLREHVDSDLDSNEEYTYRVVASAENQTETSNEATSITDDIDEVCGIAPLSLNFGGVEVGSSRSLPLEIFNTGGGRLSGALASECAEFLVEESPFDLGPGERAVREVVFRPTRSGSRICTIAASGDCSAIAVSGVGRSGPICALSTGQLDFGTASVGEFHTQAISVENVGDGILAGEIQLSQEFPQVFFLVGGNSPFALQAGETRDFTLNFVPYELGRPEAILSFGTSGCSSVRVLGTVEGQVVCQWADEELDFGPREVGTTGGRNFRLYNRGQTTISGEMSLGDCDAFSFRTGGGPFELGPGRSLSGSLFFDPPELGTYSCYLSAGTDCPQLLVFGFGVEDQSCLIVPPILDFGDLLPGTLSENRVEITNTSSTRLDFDFSLDPRCTSGGVFYMAQGGGPVSLAPGETTAILVGFDSDIPGESYSCVVEVGNENCSPISIMGSRRPLSCQVDPPSYNFGNVLVGFDEETFFTVSNNTDERMVGTFSTQCPESVGEIPEQDRDFDIAPGEVHIVRFLLAPILGSNTCYIRSSNPDCAPIEISWNGQFPIADCNVEPGRDVEVETLFFEAKVFGFILVNTGTVELPIDVGFLDGQACTPSFEFASGDGATTLRPGRHLTVRMIFEPRSIGFHSCTIDLGSSICGTVNITGISN